MVQVPRASRSSRAVTIGPSKKGQGKDWLGELGREDCVGLATLRIMTFS